MFFHNRNVLLNHVCSIPVCVCPFCPQCLCSAAVHRGSDYIRECGHCWVMQQVPCASRSSPISTTLHGHVCSYKHIYIYLHASTCVCIHAQMHWGHMEFITDVVISLKETFYCYPYQVIYTYDTQGCTSAHDNDFIHAEHLGNMKRKTKTTSAMQCAAGQIGGHTAKSVTGTSCTLHAYLK